MTQSLMAVYSCSKHVILRNTCLKHVIWFIAKVIAHWPPWMELYKKHEVSDTTMTTLPCMTLLCSAHYCAAKPQRGYKVNAAVAGSNTRTGQRGPSAWRATNEIHSRIDWWYGSEIWNTFIILSLLLLLLLLYGSDMTSILSCVIRPMLKNCPRNWVDLVLTYKNFY